MEEICKNCKWFLETKRKIHMDDRFCRRFPKFIIVDCDDFCGEFKTKTATKKLPIVHIPEEGK